MKRVIYSLILILLSGFVYLYNDLSKAKVQLPILEIYPDIIYPGDPIFIKVNASSTPTKVLFNDKDVKISEYNDSYIGLVGVDLREEKKDHQIRIELANGMKINKPAILTMRIKEEKPLGIPDKLGGNTQQAGVNLLNNISKENSSINNIKLDPISFWKNNKFSSPLKTLFITDKYGYSRNRVGYSIALKETICCVSEESEVMAINKGKDRLTRLYTLTNKSRIKNNVTGLVSI